MDFTFELTGAAACLFYLALLSIVSIVIVLWLRGWTKGIQAYREAYNQIQDNPELLQELKEGNSDPRETLGLDTKSDEPGMRTGSSGERPRSLLKALLGPLREGIQAVRRLPWNDLSLILFLFAFAGGLLYLGGGNLVRGVESLFWPTTEGRVVDSFVRYFPPPTDDDSDRYKPIIQYEYEVDGNSYQSEGLTATMLTSSYSRQTRAERVAERYPQGREVIVHYDPDEPSSAALEPWRLGGAVYLSVFGVGLAVFGLHTLRDRLL